uniref:SelT-like protein n=1 Tax=Hirondellea gigas TaxID=1518452 RepID=A0A6A7FNW7_9CRUS
MLRDKYPHIYIMGDNYPPPSWRQNLAQILGLVKILLVLCVVVNINIFERIGQPTPAFWTWLTTNKIYACLMIFFLTNAIEGQLVSTGAFEIQFNDVPVWSKLETGRIPQPPELFQIIDNHIRLDQTPTWSDTI